MKNQWIELNKLIHNATVSTDKREHTLNNYWKLFINDSRLLASNQCVNCGRYIQVNTNPSSEYDFSLDYHTEIGGEATTINCDWYLGKTE